MSINIRFENVNILNGLTVFLLHGGLQITFLLWTPDNENVYLFYIFAALWGMGDAVIQTQINGIDMFHVFIHVYILCLT